MRTARRGNVEVPSFVRQLVRGTEKMVTSFFKGGRSERGEEEEEEEEEDEEEEEAIPCPYLDRPVLEKHLEEGHARWGLTYALASMQGWRTHMEDDHNCVPELGGELSDWGYFAVYDGHAGSVVAQYCSQHLLDDILATGAVRAADDEAEVSKGIREGFLQIDRRLRAVAQRGGWDRGGSTVAGVLLSPRRIYFANCGDSRALLCRDGRVSFSTEDHKPHCPGELKRIRGAGGSVIAQRINGSLAVSRSLGDFSYKGAEGRGQTEQMVSPEPEVCALERSPGDEFLVLACDGVWDTVGNEELCAFVRSRLQVCADLREVCAQVVDLCLYKGSLDNISIIIICFPGAPQLSSVALQQEAELEDLIEAKVADIFEELRESNEEPSLLYVLNDLASVNLPGLPPGGGITSKRNCIISAYYQQKEACKPRVPLDLGGSED